MKKWKTVKTENVVESPWVKVRRDLVELPNGVTVEDFYAVTIPDAASVVALDTQGNILLKREYRHCYGKDLWEIPAGAFEDGETDPLSVARRELLEETGYVSDEWHYLGASIDNPAKLTNYMHLYLARNCRKVSEQSLDTTEELEVFAVPFQKAVDMVMNNDICCNSSVHGILKAARLLNI